MSITDSDLLPSSRWNRPAGDAPLGQLFEAPSDDGDGHFLIKVIQRRNLRGNRRLLEETHRLTRAYGLAQAAPLKIEESDDELALLLAWPEGQHLDHVLATAGEGLDRRTLLRWARQLAAQLGEAHSSGVLHRSVAPPSVWIDGDRATLIGYSLTAVTFPDAAHRPPEVNEASPLDPGHSELGDLFSLARILLLAAERGGVQLDRDDPFRRALTTCLARKPENRWADAAGLEQALREAPDELEVAGGEARITGEVPVVPDPKPDALTAPAPQIAVPASLPRGSAEPEPAPAAEPPAAPSARRSGGWGWAAVLILLAMIAAGGWYLYDSGALETWTADLRGSAPSDEGAPPPAAEPSPAEPPPPPPPAPIAEPQDDALVLARNLVAGSEDDLFGGAEQDEAMAAALAADFEDLAFDDDPRGELVVASLFGENPLTGQENPLLSSDTRQRWLAEAIRNVGDQEALEHLTEEAAKLRSSAVSLAEWYQHVVACKEVCNLVVLGLLQEHIRRVQDLPHTLALFETGREELAGAEREKILEFIADADDPSTRLLLIGRASRVGNRALNRELSRRRVENARQMIAEAGIDPTRIETLWLGYEPPQITETVAERYGLNPALGEQRLNQSVLVVVHGAEG